MAPVDSIAINLLFYLSLIIPAAITILAFIYLLFQDAKRSKDVKEKVDKGFEKRESRKEIFEDIAKDYHPSYRKFIATQVSQTANPETTQEYHIPSIVLGIAAFLTVVINPASIINTMDLSNSLYFTFFYIISVFAVLSIFARRGAGYLFTGLYCVTNVIFLMLGFIETENLILNIIPFLGTGCLAFYLHYKMFPEYRFDLGGQRIDKNIPFEQVKGYSFKKYLENTFGDTGRAVLPIVLFFLVIGIFILAVVLFERLLVGTDNIAQTIMS